jgi:predicted nucleic acid-binding protein
MLVLDASVALAWTFEDESSPYANYAVGLLASRRGVVPSIWPLEVINGLLSSFKRGRVDEAAAARLLTILHRLPLDIDQASSNMPSGQRMLELGARYSLSSYDASYLELAMRRGLPLATQDERLANAATAAGVEILRP